MTARVFPTNAARGGSAVLVGAGSASDIFTFSVPCQVVVQNNTSATVYAHFGTGAGVAANQGDIAIPAGSQFVSEGWFAADRPGSAQYDASVHAFVSIYGAAGTTVNGTTTAGLVIYGVQ